MELNDKIIFLYQLRESLDSRVVQDFDEIRGLEEYKKIVDSISMIKESLLDTDCFKKILKVVINIDIIETYANILKQPIHINQFQDKYGNQVLTSENIN